MISLWLSVTVLLTISPVWAQDATVTTLRLFPALNSTLAGVFQVTAMDDQRQPEYAYNASEARELCQQLGVNIASIAQVQEALNRGLETCRFGWVDEQIAVVPRINPRKTCGKGGLGVVTWRADVTKKFDVFCFNSSVEDTQPLNVTLNVAVEVVTEVIKATVVMLPEEAPARMVGSAGSSTGGKAVLITSLCGVLLVAVIVAVYLKLRRRRQQTEDVETE